MFDLTVDIQTLMHGAGLGDETRRGPCRQLLELIRESPNGGIAIDDEGLIATTYSEKCRNSPLGSQWVRLLVARDRVRTVPRARIPRRAKVALEAKGFRAQHEDYRVFVRTAASSRAKIIVTDDPHFHRVARILRQELEISVLTPEQACDLLREAGT